MKILSLAITCIMLIASFSIGELRSSAYAQGRAFAAPDFTHQNQTLSVPVMKANYGLYNAFVAERGGNPLVIDNFVSSNSNRVVVDMVLLQQALRLGGLNVKLEYYAAPNPARAESDVKAGISPLLGYETWVQNFDDRVYMSDAIIGDGEFLKVVVGRHDNGKGLMKAKSLDDLLSMSAVTGHRWIIDQKTLKGMGVTNVTLAPRYSLQLKMLQERRVDFGLFEYPNISKSMPEGLAVVSGITIGLRSSRHFMVSKTHPMGATVYQALTRGIKRLNARGAFRRAYEECGFLSKELRAWRRIYP